MSAVPTTRRRAALTWQSFEAWVGTWSSALALFVLGVVVFALQSVALPVGPGRDMGRYVQAFLQLGYSDPVLTSVADTRGPLASLGVGLPLELGGAAAEVWLAILYAASIVAWSAVAMYFGPRAAMLTAALLLVNPGYGILFHGLASDSLFAAAFSGWALLLARAILRPSLATFALAGVGMGALVLVRPANQLLIVMTLLPLVLRASWGERARWAAAFFIASTAVTQGWKAVMTLRYGDATSLRPSGAFLVVALVLAVLLVRAPWRRRLLFAAIPLLIVAVVVRGGVHPTRDARTLVQSPPSNVFLFRAFEIDRIVSPDNGPESRKLADCRRARAPPVRAVPLVRCHPRRRVHVRERSHLRRRHGGRRGCRHVGRHDGSDPRAFAAVRRRHRTDRVGAPTCTGVRLVDRTARRGGHFGKRE